MINCQAMGAFGKTDRLSEGLEIIFRIWVMGKTALNGRLGVICAKRQLVHTYLFCAKIVAAETAPRQVKGVFPNPTFPKPIFSVKEQQQ
jgi:hypothetical protein